LAILCLLSPLLFFCFFFFIIYIFSSPLFIIYCLFISLFSTLPFSSFLLSFFFSYIFSSFLARQSCHHFFNQDVLWCVWNFVVKLSPSSPILGLLCENQVCRVGVSCLVCSITKEHHGV
jgi:hypothetical protein